MLRVRESEPLDCKIEHPPTLFEFHLIMLYSVLFVITFIIYAQHLQRHRVSGAPAMGLHTLHQAQQPAIQTEQVAYLQSKPMAER